MGNNYTNRLLFIALFGLFIVTTGRTQDARFAQFYATPLQVNPALTGVMNGQTRLIANYRNLYSSVLGTEDAFKTLAASADIRRPVGKGNFYGLGLSVMRDQAGVSRFTRSQMAVSGSYQQQLGGSRYSKSANFLVAGAQLGFGQRGFDFEKLWFSNQFFVDNATREAYIDMAAAPGEDFPSMNTGLYANFNAGLLWYASFDDNTSIYVGGSAHHLNEPNISLLPDAEDKLFRKYVVHAGGELPLGRKSGFSLLPAAIVMSQGPAFSAMAGANVRYTQREWKEVALRIGAWSHLSNRLESTSMDAVTVSVILETERLQFGVSYDLTVSDLAVSNNSRGAFEMSVMYVAPAKYRSRVECPKF